jgi:hypothetical protein
MLMWVGVLVRAAVIGEVYIPRGFATAVELSRLWIRPVPPFLTTELRMRHAVGFGIRCRHTMFSAWQFSVRESRTG